MTNSIINSDLKMKELESRDTSVYVRAHTHTRVYVHTHTHTRTARLYPRGEAESFTNLESQICPHAVLSCLP